MDEFWQRNENLLKKERMAAHDNSICDRAPSGCIYNRLSPLSELRRLCVFVWLSLPSYCSSILGTRYEAKTLQ